LLTSENSPFFNGEKRNRIEEISKPHPKYREKKSLSLGREGKGEGEGSKSEAVALLLHLLFVEAKRKLCL